MKEKESASENDAVQITEVWHLINRRQVLHKIYNVALYCKIKNSKRYIVAYK